MNLFDIIVLVVLAFFALKGLARGLVNEVSSLSGLLLGGFCAYKLYPTLAYPIQTILHLPLYVSRFLAFLLILFAVGFVAHIVGNLVTTALKLVMMGGVNRLGGIAIGLAEGILLLSLLCSAANSEFMPETLKGKVRRSEIANLFAVTGDKILTFWRSAPKKMP